MKDLLTVRIVWALDDDFLNYLSSYLKKEKRQSLLILLKNIVQHKKNNEQINKQIIFKKVFEKQWNKENDYLLRNELKLLKDKIEKIYINYQTPKYIQTIENKIKLDFYRKIKISDEYYDLYQTYQKEKQAELNFGEAIERNLEYADYARINTTNYQERANLLEKNLFETEQNLIYYYTIHKYKIDTIKSHLLLQKKQLSNQKNNIVFEYSAINIPAHVQKNVFNDYCIAYANAYSNFDTSTIEQWENVYELFKKIPKQFKNYEKELYQTLSTLATVCSIRLDFVKSDYYFNILFNTLPNYLLKQNMNAYLNYITNLNKLKRFNETRQQLANAAKLFGKNITQTPQYRTQSLVTAIYLNDKSNLKKILTIDFDLLQPFERIFYRLFYCIYFIQENEYEMAFTEIQNLQRSKLMTEIDSFFGLIADYFYVCIKALNNHYHINKFPQKSIQEIIQVQRKIIDSNLPMLLNYTPYLWMKEKINTYFQ